MEIKGLMAHVMVCLTQQVLRLEERTLVAPLLAMVEVSLEPATP